jgi:hypothetical protein
MSCGDFAWLGLLFSQRRDAWLRFASVVSCGFSDSYSLPMAFCVGFATIALATLGVGLLESYLCGFLEVMNLESASRRQVLRRTASFCLRLVLWLLSFHVRLYGILSRRRDERRRFASVLSCGFPRLMYNLYGILSRRRNDRRCDALRWFANVFSCILSKLIYAIYGIFCLSLDVRCRSVSIVSYGVSMLLLA